MFPHYFLIADPEIRLRKFEYCVGVCAYNQRILYAVYLLVHVYRTQITLMMLFTHNLSCTNVPALVWCILQNIHYYILTPGDFVAMTRFIKSILVSEITMKHV